MDIRQRLNDHQRHTAFRGTIAACDPLLDRDYGEDMDDILVDTVRDLFREEENE